MRHQPVKHGLGPPIGKMRAGPLRRREWARISFSISSTGKPLDHADDLRGLGNFSAR
jgi:hypothetical protein